MISQLSLTVQDNTPVKLKRLVFLKIARLNDYLERFDQQAVEEAKSLGVDILVFCDRTFKTSNGFRSVPISYNYLLLMRRARLCAKLGLYQPQDIIFSTKLRFVVPLPGSLQPHFPVKLIQKLHLYA